MKKILSILAAGVSLAMLVVQGAAASPVYQTGSNGVDVSSPNCTAKFSSVNFGIVGVNNGIVYGHNSCLTAEARHFTNLSLYINTGLNASASSTYYTQAQVGCNGDASCAAYNYGYNAAQDSLKYAASQGVSSTKWWLDVETMNTWNKDVAQNQRSLQGAYDAVAASGATTVGVYSTSAQWQTITGNWQNNWPSWGATTWTTAAQAQTYCTGHQFTGGPSLLMQYKSKQSKIDQDVAC
ncbi:MAG TPA: hypothetical protein VLF87_00295 [Patescibacteria group bacterium]|nr:hypothetical protein [Patescibacteria group bacterium]